MSSFNELLTLLALSLPNTIHLTLSIHVLVWAIKHMLLTHFKQLHMYMYISRYMS